MPASWVVTSLTSERGSTALNTRLAHDSHELSARSMHHVSINLAFGAFDCQCGTKDYCLCVPPPAAPDDEAVASEPLPRVSTAASRGDSRGGAVPSRGGGEPASRGGDTADPAATAASTVGAGVLADGDASLGGGAGDERARVRTPAAASERAPGSR
jgi:hypothetical protein